MKFITRIRNFFFVALLCGSQYACQDCNDCDIYDKDPFILVNFMNQDSLTKVQARITTVNAAITNLQAQDTPEADAEIVVLNAEREKLTKVVSKINSKRFKIDSLRGLQTEKVVYFRDSLFNDSLINFRFPLKMNSDTSVFYIHTRNQTDTLMVKYERELINRENIITIRAFNVEVTKAPYTTPPVINYSGSAKNSNETTITLTF